MRIARALTATALAVGLAAVPAAADAEPVNSAAAAQPCRFSQAKLSSSKVTLGLTKAVTIKVTATATGCEDYPDGAPFGLDEGGHDGDIGPSAKNPKQWVGSFQVNPLALENVWARTHGIYVDLYNDGTRGQGDDVPLVAAELGLFRHTRLAAGAPSSVTKNKTFKVEGFLEKADWDESQYVSVDDWFVHIETKPKAGKWTKLKTVNSGTGRRGGVLDFNTKIAKETCFRFVYEGFDYIAPVTKEAGCVKIKK